MLVQEFITRTEKDYMITTLLKLVILLILHITLVVKVEIKNNLFLEKYAIKTYVEKMIKVAEIATLVSIAKRENKSPNDKNKDV